MAEIENERIKNKELRIKNEQIKRRNWLQYSGILLSLVFLFLGVFLMARKFRKIKEHKIYLRYIKVAEATLFISFLIFFEFILVFLDPFLENITGSEPAYKLLINAILAGVIFPLHSFFEKKIKTSVIKTERNKWVSEIKNTGSKTILLIAGFVFISLLNISFSDNADSLKTLLSHAKEDTCKINLLIDIGWELMYQYPDTAIALGKQALKKAKKINYLKGIANSNNNLGVYYWIIGAYPQSLSHHYKALEIRKQLNNKQGIAASLSNIGIINNIQGDNPSALKHYLEALEINMEIRNNKNIAANLSNIGNIYYEQGDITNALKSFLKTLEIGREMGNMSIIILSLGNIGNIYTEQGNYPFALKCYFEAIELAQKQENKTIIAEIYGNIGFIFIKQKKYKKAEKYLIEAMSISESIGLLNEKMKIEKIISVQLYFELHQYQLAFEHYKKYSTAKDSLFNEEKSKEIGKLEQKHEIEMVEFQRVQKEAEQARISTELKERKNNLQYSAILISMLFLFVLVFFLVKIPLPEWIVELSTFVPFMILFEFTLILIDPYIENYTGGEPIYKLLINAVCALILFPIHSFFEKKLKAHIYEINRKKEEKFEEEFRKEAEKF